MDTCLLGNKTASQFSFLLWSCTRRRTDPGGYGHLQAALKQRGLIPYKEEENSDSSSSSSGDEDEATAGADGPKHHHHHHHSESFDREASEKFRGKGKKKGAKDVKRKDYYALLGLENERWTATDHQLKMGYRKMCLLHHPDKCGAATADPKTKAALEDNFKSIQEAWECLSDPKKRKEFDSTDVFDDSLPDTCKDGDFFKVFGAAFFRQARWSEAKPVPEVGDDATPIEKVYKFYDFWFKFKSWREFPHPDEEDEEMAGEPAHLLLRNTRRKNHLPMFSIYHLLMTVDVCL